MHVGRPRGAEILDGDNVEAELPALPRGRFNAEIGRNAAEHEGLDATAAELEFEFRAVEGTPLPLGDQKIAWRRQILHKIAPAGGQGARNAHRFVHGLQRRVGEIRREFDPHQKDRRMGGAETACQNFGGGDDIRRGMRRHGRGDDAFLQVNQDKSGGVGIEMDHRAPRREFGLGAHPGLAGARKLCEDILTK